MKDRPNRPNGIRSYGAIFGMGSFILGDVTISGAVGLRNSKSRYQVESHYFDHDPSTGNRKAGRRDNIKLHYPCSRPIIGDLVYPTP